MPQAAGKNIQVCSKTRYRFQKSVESRNQCTLSNTTGFDPHCPLCELRDFSWGIQHLINKKCFCTLWWVQQFLTSRLEYIWHIKWTLLDALNLGIVFFLRKSERLLSAYETNISKLYCLWISADFHCPRTYLQNWYPFRKKAILWKKLWCPLMQNSTFAPSLSEKN